jgi:hypothetical protein
LADQSRNVGCLRVNRQAASDVQVLSLERIVRWLAADLRIGGALTMRAKLAEAKKRCLIISDRALRTTSAALPTTSARRFPPFWDREASPGSYLAGRGPGVTRASSPPRWPKTSSLGWPDRVT